MLERYHKIVVTGGCGFIGKHLVSDLISQKKKVVIVDNLSTSYDKKFAENAEIILHDIRSVDGLARQIAGSQIILHLAGNSNGSISLGFPFGSLG